MVCAASVGEALSAAGGVVGCELAGKEASGPLHRGARLLVGEGEGERCALRHGAIAGERRLALGLPIDLNVASAADLDALPGIGPGLAARILADRASRGKFGRVEDLRRVRGIGPKRLARLRPLVEVR
jgi:competence protein ComEA